MRQRGVHLYALISIAIYLPTISGKEEKIIDGKDTKYGDYPYLVRLMTGSGREDFCGGSILNMHWVITSASCVHGKAPADLKLIAGDYSIRDADMYEQPRGISTIEASPLYDASTKTSDIALIKVDKPFDLNTNVAVVAMMKVPLDDVANLEVAGWGRKWEDFDFHPEKIEAKDVDHVKNDVCKKAYDGKSSYTVDNKVICFTSPTGGTCLGDHGGPVIVKMYGQPHLAGIINDSESCLGGGSPYLSARVCSYNQWIATTIKVSKADNCKTKRNMRTGAGRSASASGSGARSSMGRGLSAPLHVEAKTIEPKEWPSIVRLVIGHGGQTKTCSGSIMNNYWVLTAASCVYGRAAGTITLVAGENTISKKESGEQKRGAGKVIVHSDYSPDKKLHDVALIKVDKPFELNSYVASIRLTPTRLEDVNNFQVAGWEKTEGQRSSGSDVLLTSRQYNQVQKICRQLYNGTEYTITDDLMCGTNLGLGPCVGEPGGPLVVEIKRATYLAGIVTRGRVCGFLDFPTLYSRASSYVNWVAQHAF